MSEEALAVEVARIDAHSKDNARRISKVEERQDDLDKLVSSIGALANEQEHIKTDVSEIKNDVKTLTERPAKRWDALIAAIISTLVGLILGAIISGAL